MCGDLTERRKVETPTRAEEGPGKQLPSYGLSLVLTPKTHVKAVVYVILVLPGGEKMETHKSPRSSQGSWVG